MAARHRTPSPPARPEGPPPSTALHSTRPAHPSKGRVRRSENRKQSNSCPRGRERQAGAHPCWPRAPPPAPPPAPSAARCSPHPASRPQPPPCSQPRGRPPGPGERDSSTWRVSTARHGHSTITAQHSVARFLWGRAGWEGAGPGGQGCCAPLILPPERPPGMSGTAHAATDGRPAARRTPPPASGARAKRSPPIQVRQSWLKAPLIAQRSAA